MVTGPTTKVMTFGFSLSLASHNHYLHLSMDSINHQLRWSSVSIKSDLHQFVTINSTFRCNMHHQCITDCHCTMQLNWNLLENHAITGFGTQTYLERILRNQSIYLMGATKRPYNQESDCFALALG